MKKTSAKKKVLAIIPSAGMGRRMGSKKKNYLDLLGRPVLAHTLKPFEDCPLVNSVIIVVPPSDEAFCRTEIVEKYGFKKVIAVVAGGAERQDSVGNGLTAAGDEWDVILVHDGARPLVTRKIIEGTVLAAISEGGSIAAVRVKDTIKEVSGWFVKRTIPRDTLWSVQTPQAFQANILKKAFTLAKEDGFIGTDESSLVERLGEKVVVVEGSYENLKITTEEDLIVAERILKNRGA